MEELSMKETLKAGDERKVEEDFFPVYCDPPRR